MGSQDPKPSFFTCNSSFRFNHIQHLLYPLETVLDDSIGCAIWFAARGCGILGNTEQIGKPYKSTAKVR